MMRIKFISLFLVFVLNFHLCIAAVPMPNEETTPPPLSEKTDAQKGLVVEQAPGESVAPVKNSIMHDATSTDEALKGNVTDEKILAPESEPQPGRYIRQDLRAPQWEEFAAANQINPKLSSEGGIVLEQTGAFIVALTIFGLPIAFGMLLHADKRKESNYWYGRKQNFVNAVNYCNQFQNKADVYACYQDVRNNEMMKNTRNSSGQVRKYY